MNVIEADVLVVGGGSGGFGAAYRAARHNPDIKVIVIDTMHMLGGTSTAGGVNNWEPGVGGLGVHYDLYERLSQQENAIGVGETVHFYKKEEPYGFSKIDPNCPYEQSLRRSATPRLDWRRVHFEPQLMADMMETMLTEVGVDIHYRTRFTQVHVDGQKIKSVVVQPLDEGEPYEIRSKLYVDASGGVHLCLAAECGTAFGEESFKAYDEPSAPEEPSPIVNGISQIYRVTPTDTTYVDELPEEALTPEVQDWLANNNPATAITEYPNGDLCMNVLPTMQGNEFHSRSYEESRKIAMARMYAEWHRMQTQYGFDKYRFHSMLPMVGIRESHRLIGRYVLKEQDIRAGLLHQPKKETTIAFADHAMDTHGERNVKGPKLGELEQPYGVPYECLLPKEYNNLITATRGSSFSHIGASSCRLSRTMMAMGEAAGVASAIAIRDRINYPDVPVDEIRETLKIPEFIEKVIREWHLEETDETTDKPES